MADTHDNAKQSSLLWRILKWLRLPLVAFIFFFIFRRIDFQELKSSITGIAWWTIPLVIGVNTFAVFLQGVRIWVLIRAFSNSISLLKALKYHFVSAFYSLILPSSIAQDVVRAVLFTRHIDYSIAWSATWVFKLTFVCTWVLFSAIGLVFLEEDVISVQVKQIILIAMGVTLISVFLSFNKRITAPIRGLLTGKIPKKVQNAAENIRQGVFNYRNRKRYLVAGMGITLFLQLNLVLGSGVILYGTTGKWYLIELFALIPIIDIITIIIPLTPQSIGVREALFAVMFERAGLTKEEAALFILVNVFSYTSKLFGGIPALYDIIVRPSDSIAGREVLTRAKESSSHP
ncbi:MAG: flippase-like domain-containing protein [Chitinivibrionales bacterium]|nr:flippase-like domain-containing protein [Chitinivibrionales bacterium]